MEKVEVQINILKPTTSRLKWLKLQVHLFWSNEDNNTILEMSSFIWSESFIV